MILDLIKKTRTHRSYEDKKVSKEDILKILEGARLSSAGANKQILRYAIVTDNNLCDEIFKLSHWATQIEWKPTLEESPRSYIIILTEKNLNFPNKFLYTDIGIASQNMRLMAFELGYETALIDAPENGSIEKILGLDDGYKAHFSLAIGDATDNIILTTAVNGDMKYTRVKSPDGKYTHYVPKLSIDEIVVLEN